MDLKKIQMVIEQAQPHIEKKRKEREESGYRFVASCNTDFKTLYVYERWDRILMV